MKKTHVKIMPYYVYVIKLDKEVINSKKFRERNPNLKPRLSCFYVGQTCHEPAVRFKQHKDGYKSNRFVRKYGKKLCQRKSQKYNPIKTRNEAEEIEQKLTKKLRAKGHGVWSN